MKRKIFEALLSAPVFYMTARLRYLPILYLIKRFKKFGKLGWILELMWNPNLIRKSVNIFFQENIVKVNTKDFQMYVDVNDEPGYIFFMNESLEKGVQIFAEKLKLKHSDYFLDIGANTGLIAIPVSMISGCKVIAVEASKANASLLLKNAWANNIVMTTYTCCLVDSMTRLKQTWIEFYLNIGNKGASSLHAGWNPSKGKYVTEKVPTATLDEIITEEQLNNIRLVKMDVEGAEDLVFLGGKNLLKTKAPIIFEYRINILRRDTNKTGKEFLDLLRKDYTFFSLSEEGKLEHFDEENSYKNAVAIPISKLSMFEPFF